LKAKSDFSGRITVPVLWDKFTNTIVSNDSAEIMLMINNGFDCDNGRDFYPEELKAEIDEMNSFIAPRINFAVYKVAGATSQEVYDREFDSIYEAFDRVEEILSRQRYLVGDRLTIADLRLFATIIRFDVVYYALFKINGKRLQDYPNIWGFIKELYQIPEIHEMVDFEHIKILYYTDSPTLNPNKIIPKGPAIDFNQPHNRHN